MSIVFGTPTTGNAVLGVESRRDAQRVLAADCDEGAEARAGEVSETVDAAVLPERIGARRAEDGAAAGQDARDLLRAEILELALDEAAPPLADADHLVALRPRAPRDRADDCVQARTIAAACEDADAHRARLSQLWT